MDFKEQLMNFQHFDIVALCLFVFVIIATGVFTKINKNFKQEITTRKFYPELIEIYYDYFPNRAVFNIFGHILADEPLFRAPRLRFPWQYRLGFPYGLLQGTMMLSSMAIAGFAISLYFYLHGGLSFSLVSIFFIAGVILFLFQMYLKKLLRTRIQEMHERIDLFLKSKSLTENDVFIPAIKQSTIISHSFLYVLYGAVIMGAVFLLTMSF